MSFIYTTFFWRFCKIFQYSCQMWVIFLLIALTIFHILKIFYWNLHPIFLKVFQKFYWKHCKTLMTSFWNFNNISSKFFRYVTDIRRILHFRSFCCIFQHFETSFWHLQHILWRFFDLFVQWFWFSSDILFKF